MIGHYCKPCGEMLGPDDAQCPFCMNPATPLDELDAAIVALADIDCDPGCDCTFCRVFAEGYQSGKHDAAIEFSNALESINPRHREGAE